METSSAFEEIFPKLPELELMKSKWGELKKFPDRVRMLLKVLPESIRGMEERHLDSAFIKKLQDDKELEGAPETIEFHRSCITLLSFLTKRQKRSIERGLASFIKRTYNLHNVKPHSRGWIIYGQKSFSGTLSNETNEKCETNKVNKTKKALTSNKTNNPNNTTSKKKETNQNSQPKTENNLNKIQSIRKQESSFQNRRKRKTSLKEKERSTSHKKQNKIQNTKKKKKKNNKKTKTFQISNTLPLHTNVHKQSDFENNQLFSSKQLDQKRQILTNPNLVQPELDYPFDNLQQKATILIEFWPKIETKEDSWFWEFERRFPSDWN
ncbi:hypothetical protein M0813_25317 [Anaeramoeba flamelloides]|uniref:Uncharacterized protein n=1 Tax=Anaeramoeba flamelloides TaxID=1746091 RepID=A0ABQ8Y3E4_9EUKA|nr:hypothetical protein M0813_25317 [Anaeramoeba flamelloides]